MKIKTKIEIINEINVEEIITYDVHYLKSAYKGNSKGSRVIAFLNMPTYDDIIDNKPEGFIDGNYTTLVKERRIIKDLDNNKYIYNYPYCDKPFTPLYYPIIEN